MVTGSVGMYGRLELNFYSGLYWSPYTSMIELPIVERTKKKHLNILLRYILFDPSLWSPGHESLKLFKPTSPTYDQKVPSPHSSRIWSPHSTSSHLTLLASPRVKSPEFSMAGPVSLISHSGLVPTLIFDRGYGQRWTVMNGAIRSYDPLVQRINARWVLIILQPEAYQCL